MRKVPGANGGSANTKEILLNIIVPEKGTYFIYWCKHPEKTDRVIPFLVKNGKAALMTNPYYNVECVSISIEPNQGLHKNMIRWEHPNGTMYFGKVVNERDRVEVCWNITDTTNYRAPKST